MGASIYWQPLRGKYLPVGLRSRFVTMMTEAFGAYPWNLNAGHVDRLEAMAIGSDDDGIKEALRTLARAVSEHEQITVWAEY